MVPHRSKVRREAAAAAVLLLRCYGHEMRSCATARYLSTCVVRSHTPILPGYGRSTVRVRLRRRPPAFVRGVCSCVFYRSRVTDAAVS